MSHPQTHAISLALSMIGQLVRHGQLQQHEQEMTALRNGALSHVVDALVTGRIEVVKQGFEQVLSQYAEQARHYMAQQKDFADRELDANDPLRRIELRSRIHKIDVELATLRADARLLFDRMTEVITSLGGSSAEFVAELSQPLLLPRSPS